MGPLPWIFVVLAAGAMLSGIYLLWESLRAALGATEPPEVQATAEADAHRRLRERKDALLNNLRDLKFDHDGGKISTPDFETLDAKLRGQAKEVLRLLDEDAAPFRQRAEEMITESLASAGGTPYRTKPADRGPEEDVAAETEGPDRGEPETVARTESAEPVRLECPECATPNEPDAVFCKKCGTRVDGDVDPVSAPEEEGS